MIGKNMETNETKYDKNFILNSIKKLGQKYGMDEVFKDVVICCAYALANNADFNEKRENEYLRIINKYLDNEKEEFPKILASLFNEYNTTSEPIDILGDVYIDLGLFKKEVSQFFTPLPVCNLMAKITIDQEDKTQELNNKGYISVLDPTCGSGRLLYASYNELLNRKVDNNKIILVGDDIDLTCCCITYIQLSLLGANAIVHHQNSLTNDIYDTFYTATYVLNKELQQRIIENEKGELGFE